MKSYRLDISLFLSVFWSTISSSSSSSLWSDVKCCWTRWFKWCKLRLRSRWGYWSKCSFLINDVVCGIIIGFVLIVVDERILVGIWLLGVWRSPKIFIKKLKLNYRKYKWHTPPHHCNRHALVKKWIRVSMCDDSVSSFKSLTIYARPSACPAQ